MTTARPVTGWLSLRPEHRRRLLPTCCADREGDSRARRPSPLAGPLFGSHARRNTQALGCSALRPTSASAQWHECSVWQPPSDRPFCAIRRRTRGELLRRSVYTSKHARNSTPRNETANRASAARSSSSTLVLTAAATLPSHTTLCGG